MVFPLHAVVPPLTLTVGGKHGAGPPPQFILQSIEFANLPPGTANKQLPQSYPFEPPPPPGPPGPPKPQPPFIHDLSSG